MEKLGSVVWNDTKIFFVKTYRIRPNGQKVPIVVAHEDYYGNPIAYGKTKEHALRNAKNAIVNDYNPVYLH